MMHDFSRDPIVNAVYGGIKKGIQVTHENQCYGSILILLYSGIDTMAYLNMPAGQVDVHRQDFVDWCERYIRFPCNEQLTGLELYSARCAVVHNFSVVSNLVREGKCRTIGYINRMVPEIKFSPEKHKNLVIVSIEALVEAFFQGIDAFLVDAYAKTDKVAVIEPRLRSLLQALPFKGASQSEGV